MSAVPARHTCPLCGFRFEEEPARCRACPVAIGCETICCPHCHYTFAPGSRLLGVLHRLFNRTGGKVKKGAGR